ncbi:MAG: phosphoribosyltransferase [Eubacterium sp.]|jgi:ComF family protein|nr:phosphoribosyltransferase [Eubacterium sp.]
MSPGSPICICKNCAEEIDYFNNSINSLNLPRDIETYCDGMICVGKYCESLKNALKRFKFSNKPSYYRAFGKLLALKVKNTDGLGKLDLIIPVPMHKSKQKARGYNQAALIAGYTAKNLGIYLNDNILTKPVESKSQSLLMRSERLTNLDEVFKVDTSRSIANKNILLVDDIITTGSTINQCSKVLKLAGAGKIIAGVIATTRGDYQKLLNLK